MATDYDGGLDAVRAFREASDFFCERWKSGDAVDTWEGLKLDSGRAVALRVAGTYANRCRMPDLPAEVGLLQGLGTLELCWMKRLSRLPPELGKLTRLTMLNLSGCQQLLSLPQLENKLQTEKEIRKKLEGELKAALDKCLASEEENQMLLKEYEEVVEENKFLVSQIENLSK